MTVVELTRVEAAQEPAQPEAVLLDGRYRLDALVGRVGGTALWRAVDQLLCRPVAVHLLPGWRQVPPELAAAVQASARVSDRRLATVFDVDYDADHRYIVSEWVSDPNLEQLLRTGLPGPALATTIIAEAAEALAVAHQAGRPHLRLSARSLHWGSSGLKITGLGIDAALSADGRPEASPLSAADAAVADTTALARVLYALLTGCWPGDERTALPPAPRYRGLSEPRQLRPEVPPKLNAIVCHTLREQAGWGIPSISAPAELAAALRATLAPPRISARLSPASTARHARNCPDGGARPAFHAA
jgi:eukaryotic-like serine/threonine-protein kinase